MSTKAPKGHWPRGKRRNAEVGEPAAKSLQRWLSRVRGGDEPDLSLRGVARAIGSDGRSLGRYAAGTHWPSPAMAQRLHALRMATPDSPLRRKARRLLSGGSRR